MDLNLLLPAASQVERLRNDIRQSVANGTVWQVLGNTVVMGPLNTPDVETAIQQTYGTVGQAVLEVGCVLQAAGCPAWSLCSTLTAQMCS